MPGCLCTCSGLEQALRQVGDFNNCFLGDDSAMSAAQDTSIFQDASANMSSNSGMSASGGNIVSSRDPADTVSTAAPAAAPGAAAGPAGAAAGPASAVVVGYGTSTFHVDLAASPGVATNATGVVYVNINPQENTWVTRLHTCSHSASHYGTL